MVYKKSEREVAYLSVCLWERRDREAERIGKIGMRKEEERKKE